MSAFSSGPTDKVFEQFRERFPNIPVDLENLRLWKWPEVTRPHTFLVAQALSSRSFCEQQLQRESFARDDYRELGELIVKFLGGQVCSKVNETLASSPVGFFSNNFIDFRLFV